MSLVHNSKGGAERDIESGREKQGELAGPSDVGERKRRKASEKDREGKANIGGTQSVKKCFTQSSFRVRLSL